MAKVRLQDVGRIPYAAAWQYQEHLLAAAVARKMDNRQRQKDGQAPLPIQHYLLCCEHPPVYTLGKSGSMEHLLLSAEALREQGFEFYKINRGGDITYHGPGQIVGYPIFDLDEFFTDAHRYVRSIEEVVIRTLAEFDLVGDRRKGYTGVWLPATDQLPDRKICAIGVHLRRWVTLHGFAFNIQTDLSHFAHIIPCGIMDEDKTVTSLSAELHRPVSLEEVKPLLWKHFAEVFDFVYTDNDLLDALLDQPGMHFSHTR